MNFKKRETLLGAVAAICLVLFVGDRLVLSPLVDGWKERAAKIEELDLSLLKGRALIGQEDRYKRRWQEMKAMALPEEESEAEGQVLKSMNQWARESRLNVTSLRPRWRESKNEFKRLEIRASCQGSMSEIARFLYTLETASTPLALESVGIVSRADDLKGLVLSLLASAPLKLAVEKSERGSGRARGTSSR